MGEADLHSSDSSDSSDSLSFEELSSTSSNSSDEWPKEDETVKTVQKSTTESVREKIIRERAERIAERHLQMQETGSGAASSC